VAPGLLIAAGLLVAVGVVAVHAGLLVFVAGLSS
jgi:hypothetical protein